MADFLMVAGYRLRPKAEIREGTAVVASQSPTALKWWFAVEMRRMRDSKGFSREDAARAIKGSTP